MEKVLLIGAGALACDLIDLVGADKFVAAYVDPQFAQAESVDGVRICTDWNQAMQLASHYVLAVSSTEHRARARARAVEAGLEPSSPIVSTSARIARSATLARGCAVGYFSAVGPGARIGLDCLIMHGVVIGHNSIIEENVVVCAGVCMGGYVTIGAHSFVGTNAVLAPKVSVISGCFIAAGAACLRDVPANSLMIGSPARRHVKGDPRG
jgi:sugar O-acyltransferase (sialic acid O-acetyltransferase NeuD family)